MQLQSNRIRLSQTLSWIFLSLSLLLSPWIANGQTNYIHDNANVLSSAMKDKLEKLLTELDEKKNLRIEEVILPSFENKDPEAVVRELAQNLDSHTSNAEYRALILFVLDNGTVQIYPNEKLATLINDKAKTNIIQNAKLKLSAKNYDEMARIGIAGIFHYYQKGAAQAGDKSTNDQTKKYVNILIMIIGLVAVVGLILFSRKKS